jgi:cysteine desulfurase/selenocysteine lyase
MSQTTLASNRRAFDVAAIRADFPILARQVHGQPLIYLDNAATTQKPQVVIDTLQHYYRDYNANVHRGLHALSEQATAAVEQSRQIIQRFLNANSVNEIVFTSGCTASLNTLALAFSQGYLRAGDEVMISAMEHHANIVPWQMACQRTGAILKVIPINDLGELNINQALGMMNQKTRLLSLVHVSNTLGSINPLQTLINAAHVQKIPVIIDGAQAVAHLPVDVQAMDCDFYVFSGHKIFGPTGTGVLYGKAQWLDQLPPVFGGGDMIETVSFERSTYAKAPHKFEAGTPNIAGIIGLGAAITYLQQFDMAEIEQHEQQLLARAKDWLAKADHLQVLGDSAHKAPVISFYCDDVHPHDLSTLLDYEGIAIRAGHHCTMPLMQRFNVPATVRASMSFYNTMDEVDWFFAKLQQVRRQFQ